ncbi:MAG TPA: lipopolysaccharide assembly protein LapA domain-containing protein [Rubrivivax sp.]|nr:lipopolysaccharide assembly protein LapA domain-containing protein [Burkholderiales bacterium]HNT39389.1 lipopolysaccharide assembly protein LapA domain-containing protein [Rubrivivax sp.]
MRILVWLFRAFLFFTLFAFALNNLHPVTVHWFFGVQWAAPLVIVVLVAFGSGCALGVLAMVPAWWKHRRRVHEARSAPDAEGALPARSVPAGATASAPDAAFSAGSVPGEIAHPPREGLGL